MATDNRGEAAPGVSAPTGSESKVSGSARNIRRSLTSAAASRLDRIDEILKTFKSSHANHPTSVSRDSKRDIDFG